MERLEGLFGEQTRRVGMERMGLRYYRIAGGDGGSEVASTDSVEGEREIVGPEDDDGTDGREAGTDVLLEVKSGMTPGFFARRGCGLAKLIGGAGQLDVFQAGCDRKSRLFAAAAAMMAGAAASMFVA